MQWTESKIGRYLAETSLDSKRIFLLGDPIRGFEPFSAITQPMLDAYAERTIDLERKRREYVKRHRISKREARKSNQFA